MERRCRDCVYFESPEPFNNGLVYIECEEGVCLHPDKEGEPMMNYESCDKHKFEQDQMKEVKN